ncbi:MAG: HNH endonuclease [Firmicutes bacterium]|nr:HNH endonuclease [Bacillota bacterium]
MPINNYFEKEFRGYSSNLPVRRSLDLHYSSSQAVRDRIHNELQLDFGCRCGYCGWEHEGYGRERFHIDHLNPSLKSTAEDGYSNYVFACPICNTTKGDRPLKIDPVVNEYSKLFERTSYGKIIIAKGVYGTDAMGMATQTMEILGLDKDIHGFDYLLMMLKNISSAIRKEGLSKTCSEDKDSCDAIVMIFTKFLKRKTIYR